MLYVCNYADEKYKAQQELNTSSAYEFGKVDQVIEFHENDIQDLKEAHPEHFKIPRGHGLWFWKPFLILKAFKKMKEGDYLFYCDSGAVFIDDIHLLIPDLEKSGKDMMVFEQPLLSRCFTKAETFHLMGCTDFPATNCWEVIFCLKKRKKVFFIWKSG